MLEWFFAYGTLVVGALVAFAVLFKDAESYVNLSKRRGRLLAISPVWVWSFFDGGRDLPDLRDQKTG